MPLVSPILASPFTKSVRGSETVWHGEGHYWVGSTDLKVLRRSRGESALLACDLAWSVD